MAQCSAKYPPRMQHARIVDPAQSNIPRRKLHLWFKNDRFPSDGRSPTCANKTFSNNISSLDHGIVPPEQVQAPSLVDVLIAYEHIKHHIHLQPEPCVSCLSSLSAVEPTKTHTHTHSHTMVCGKKKNHGKFDDNNNNNDNNDIADHNAQMVVVVGANRKKSLDHS